MTRRESIKLMVSGAAGAAASLLAPSVPVALPSFDPHEPEFKLYIQNDSGTAELLVEDWCEDFRLPPRSSMTFRKVDETRWMRVE